jgi:DNA-binding NarL/FixJ family response regulator
VALETYSQVHHIGVAGHDDPSYARRALALEALACQRKPVRAPDLLDAIRRACER